MFERDNWQEIFQTIRQNKLRTFLTAFSVGWGIFILIILLGSGRGLKNGTNAQFAGDAVNTLWIEPGTTSIAYKGYKHGRKIPLLNDDYELIRQKVKDIEFKSAVFDATPMRNMRVGNERANFLARPCLPDHQFLENVTMLDGRFINEIDIRDFRKVCAIGKPVVETLFKHSNPLGQYIDVDGIAFKVVGVFKDAADRDNYRIYIPLSTAQKAYNAKNNLNTIWLSTGQVSVERSQQMAEEIRTLLASKHAFSQEDLSAVFINNNSAEFKRVMNVLDGITSFVWIIGIMTLIAGIVGVSNIMMIVVKERTREIGIRKAIGASPGSIVTQILQESVFITAMAGYLGLMLGLGLLSLVNKIGIDSDYFKRPEVDLSVATMATLLIVLAGALAGFFPAIRAARIAPVVALRSE
ncbi:MAG: ABC transporter permease [Bacteroidetes bacterium]|nr:ABC transporter permease [Bacteroidota bacterium]